MHCLGWCHIITPVVVTEQVNKENHVRCLRETSPKFPDTSGIFQVNCVSFLSIAGVKRYTLDLPPTQDSSPTRIIPFLVGNPYKL